MISEIGFDLQIAMGAGSYELDSAVQDQVLEILVESTRAGIQLRTDVGEGRMGGAEAKKQGEKLKAETGARVCEIL